MKKREGEEEGERKGEKEGLRVGGEEMNSDWLQYIGIPALWGLLSSSEY